MKIRKSGWTGRMGRDYGGIKETPLMRNPILLNRYRKSSIKFPGGEAYLLKAYLRGWINRDGGLI